MQLVDLISGFLTGLPALVAVGPIALLLIELGLERGIRSGYPAALGVAAGDTAFAVLAAVTGTAVSAVLSSVESWLRLAAAAVLVGVAVRLALAARAAGAHRHEEPDRDQPAHARSVGTDTAVRGPRLAGGFLGLTVVNPLTIVVYAGIVISGGAGVGTAGWVLGMGLASLVVHGGFLTLGRVLGATVSPRAVVGMRWAAAALLAGLALNLLLA